MENDFRITTKLADTADNITLKWFRSQGLKAEMKTDGTPVTSADLETEKALRNELAQLAPEDEILGEEFGGVTHFKGRQWIIDPIDSTKNYLRNIPIWGTLIALLIDGVPRIGIVSAPALGARWWAIEQQGAYKRTLSGDTQRLQVSKVKSIENASLSFSSLSGWQAKNSFDNFLNLTNKVSRVRGFGDFYSYMLLAEGNVDIALEPEVSLWDLAAPAIIVTEAGGSFTGLNGETGPNQGSALATNSFLHQIVLGFF